MKKVAINCMVGSFLLSYKGVMRYAELKGEKVYPYVDMSGITTSWLDKPSKRFVPVTDDLLKDYDWAIWYLVRPIEESDTEDIFLEYYTVTDNREDPALIQTIEELGEEAGWRGGNLKIVEIPDDVEYEIYDSEEGYESVHEKHRVWF